MFFQNLVDFSGLNVKLSRKLLIRMEKSLQKNQNKMVSILGETQRVYQFFSRSNICMYWFTYIILLSLSKWLPSLRRIMLFRKVHKSWCSLYTLFLKPRHQSTAWPHFTPAPLCPSKLTWPNRKTKNLMLLHEKRFHEASSTKTWLFLFRIGLGVKKYVSKSLADIWWKSLYLLVNFKT